MQIEGTYVPALQGEREDRPEDDEGNTGCDGHDASPLSGLDRELGDELVIWLLQGACLLAGTR